MFDLINGDDFYTLLGEEIEMYNGRGLYEDNSGEGKSCREILIDNAEFEMDGEFLVITIGASAIDEEGNAINIFQRKYIKPQHILGGSFELEHSQGIGEC